MKAKLREEIEFLREEKISLDNLVEDGHARLLELNSEWNEINNEVKTLKRERSDLLEENARLQIAIDNMTSLFEV